MKDWKGIREEAREVYGTEACITNEEASCSILSGCCATVCIYSSSLLCLTSQEQGAVCLSWGSFAWSDTGNVMRICIGMYCTKLIENILTFVWWFITCIVRCNILFISSSFFDALTTKSCKKCAFLLYHSSVFAHLHETTRKALNDLLLNLIFMSCIKFNFKVWILLRVYNQHIEILPSTQQLFINVYSNTCFDPNGPSSGAASLTYCERCSSAPDDGPL
jgi:hypothetical protein